MVVLTFGDINNGTNTGNTDNTDGTENQTGRIWTKVSHTTLEGGIRAIAYGNGKFIACEYKGSAAAYSIDSINWTAIPITANEDYCFWNKAAAYGSNKFVIVGSDGITYSSGL
jgi:hypothetical protein